MKKKIERKLTLGKIKVARLSKAQEEMLKGGAPTYDGCSCPYRCTPPITKLYQTC